LKRQSGYTGIRLVALLPRIFRCNLHQKEIYDKPWKRISAFFVLQLPISEKLQLCLPRGPVLKVKASYGSCIEDPNFYRNKLNQS
jgi:hypothetical protein